MALVDKEIVSELVASGDPDAALVFSRGSCVVRSGEEAGSSGGVVIARRRDIPAQRGQMTEEQLEKLALALDNMARDMCG